MTDFNLQRFVDAQTPVYENAAAELAAGRKTSHWMWFIFPQIAGLGRSAIAQRYALSSLQEASAYLRHEVLGPRLHHCTRLVNQITDRSIFQIFGSPDDLKFHSCMTLFSHASSENDDFKLALNTYFAGKEDAATLVRIP